MDVVNSLIKVLLDKTASTGERDDAAMDLGDYDDDRALQALIKIVTDDQEESFIFDNCGESIARIWVKRNYFDVDLYHKTVPAARHELYGYIEINKPEWIKKYNLKP